MDHLTSLINELNYPGLKIEIHENVIHFHKNKQIFPLKINIEGETIVLTSIGNS